MADRVLPVMSFDAVAPHYRWMEFVLAGNKLQRCRTAFLDDIPRAESILLLGEGNGRFLPVCRKQFPDARITCVEASAAMIAQARQRLMNSDPVHHRVQFVHADVLAWTPPSNAAYDLIVTNFFLDCFRSEQLEQIIGIVGCVSAKNANWLLADFQVASGSVGQLRSKVILWMMYMFFRAATRLPARNLIPPDSFLQNAGFTLRQRAQTEWGLLRSDWWQRHG